MQLSPAERAAPEEVSEIAIQQMSGNATNQELPHTA
jgi:hypothetical protein